MKVRLKLDYEIKGVITDYCFNSMKVRLKPHFNVNVSSLQRFQFHEGPIKTYAPTPYERAYHDVSIP